MDFSEHNFKWWGIISRAVDVPTTVLKMVWGPILEEILAIHGVVYLWIFPNP
jgi:hypothetical protein